MTSRKACVCDIFLLMLSSHTMWTFYSLQQHKHVTTNGTLQGVRMTAKSRIYTSLMGSPDLTMEFDGEHTQTIINGLLPGSQTFHKGNM